MSAWRSFSYLIVNIAGKYDFEVITQEKLSDREASPTILVSASVDLEPLIKGDSESPIVILLARNQSSIGIVQDEQEEMEKMTDA